MAASKPRKGKTIAPEVLAAMPALDSKAVKAAKETLKKPKKINLKSTAWKDLEKRIRDLFQGFGFTQTYREQRGSDLGESTFDVKVPEIPHLINDGKYTQKTHRSHTLWKQVHKKYEAEARQASCGEEPQTIIWTQEKNHPLILATLQGKFLMELLAHYYLRGDGRPSDAWGCPRCGGDIETESGHMGRERHQCTRCRLLFETEQGKRSGK